MMQKLLYHGLYIAINIAHLFTTLHDEYFALMKLYLATGVHIHTVSKSVRLTVFVSRCLFVNVLANGLCQDHVNNITHHTCMMCCVVYTVLMKAIG